MKFFVPHAADDEQALRVWGATRDFLASQGLQTEEWKIHRLSFHHNSKPYVAEVGKVFPDLRDEVLVILKAKNPHLYYVCTGPIAALCAATRISSAMTIRRRPKRSTTEPR